VKTLEHKPSGIAGAKLVCCQVRQAHQQPASVMDAEMLDAPDLVALEDGHDDQGMTRAVEESDFMSSLGNELSILKLIAETKGWLLSDEEIVSACDFMNLSGESEVFEELNV
jgi:hypothetical protein